MYYCLLGTLFLLYLGWMLISWLEAKDENAGRQLLVSRFSDWTNRVLPR